MSHKIVFVFFFVGFLFNRKLKNLLMSMRCQLYKNESARSLNKRNLNLDDFGGKLHLD